MPRKCIEIPICINTNPLDRFAPSDKLSRKPEKSNFDKTLPSDLSYAILEAWL
jgi:hypothetical protein